MASRVTVVLLLLATMILLQQGDARKCPIGQRQINGVCLQHCFTICRKIELPCEPFLDDPDQTVPSWTAAENTPCFQVETHQLTGERFLRTSCKCPDRIYTNTSNPGALSNCILSTITEFEEEINFGQLSRVRLGAVRASGEDIDFQGKTKRSQICLVDAFEDVEFGSLTKFRHNVIDSMVIGDDLQFEPGTVVANNVFKRVNIADEFRFVEERDLTDKVTVLRNNWGNMVIAECDIETETEPRIRQNHCDSATINDSSNCGPPIAGGFDCITEA